MDNDYWDLRYEAGRQWGRDEPVLVDGETLTPEMVEVGKDAILCAVGGEMGPNFDAAELAVQVFVAMAACRSDQSARPTSSTPTPAIVITSEMINAASAEMAEHDLAPASGINCLPSSYFAEQILRAALSVSS